MNKQIILLIDADFIPWRITPAKKQTADEIIQYGDQTLRTLDDIKQELDNYILEKIIVPTKADAYIGYLGGGGNFRKEISTTYKEDRKVEKPPFWHEARNYLVDHWGFNLVYNIEAEDAVGISIDFLDPESTEYIIIGQDHDLNQLPGKRYNPVREEWVEFYEPHASYNFWFQMLTGCSTDKVSGVPKIGNKGAEKILSGYINDPYVFTIEQNLANRVLKTYIDYYKLDMGIQYFYLNFRLLKILRNKIDFEMPIPRFVSGVVKMEE